MVVYDFQISLGAGCWAAIHAGLRPHSHRYGALLIPCNNTLAD
jgi:hypothetical protein